MGCLNRKNGCISKRRENELYFTEGFEVSEVSLPLISDVNCEMSFLHTTLNIEEVSQFKLGCWIDMQCKC